MQLDTGDGFLLQRGGDEREGAGARAAGIECHRTGLEIALEPARNGGELAGLQAERTLAHARHEHVVINELPQRAALLAALMATV